MIATITLFLILSVGFGLLIEQLFKLTYANWIEASIARLGIGICSISVIAILFDLLYIPLNYMIFALIAIVSIGYWAFKKTSWKTRPTNKQLIISAALLILFIAAVMMYIGGAQNQFSFEDGDPYGYAAVTQTIAQEQTYKADYRYNHYSEPYTQGYQVFMALFAQANNSIYDTLKLIHPLILALSILFFYLYVKQLFRKQKHAEWIALFAATILLAIPSWVSRFTFSLNYNMALIPVLFYALEKTQEESKWKYIAGIAYASIIINHFYTAAITTILLGAYYLYYVIQDAKPRTDLLQAYGLGLLLSLAFHIPTNIRYAQYFTNPLAESHGGLEKTLIPAGQFAAQNPIIAILSSILIAGSIYAYIKYFPSKQLKKPIIKYATSGVLVATVLAIAYIPTKILNVQGTASRMYTASDFYTASAQNMINNPIGWGIPITILLIAGTGYTMYALYKKRDDALATTVLFAAVSFLLVHGERHAISISPFRMWTFLALFVSILTAYGIYKLVTIQRINRDSRIVIGLVILVAITITFTQATYALNTMQWPDHRIATPQSYTIYDELKEDFTGIPIANLCMGSNYLAAYDLQPPLQNTYFTPPWRRGEPSFAQEVYNLSEQEIRDALQEAGVQYVIIEQTCVQNAPSVEELQALISRVTESEYFTPVRQTDTSLLLEVS